MILNSLTAPDIIICSINAITQRICSHDTSFMSAQPHPPSSTIPDKSDDGHRRPNQCCSMCVFVYVGSCGVSV